MEQIRVGNKNLSGYRLPGIFFKKYWFWFEGPVEVPGADMVNFFSYNKVDQLGFKRKERLTTVIDLKRELSAIWEKMREGFIRKQIIKGERNGIVVRQDENFSDFKRIYGKFRKDKNIHEDNFRVFEKNGILFSAYLANRMIAGGIFIANNNCFRAWVLASKRLSDLSGPEREIVGQANRTVIWQAIKYAKEKNYEVFDLGGINPESEDRNESSLAEFKEAFGGERKNGYFYYKIYSKILKILIR